MSMVSTARSFGSKVPLLKKCLFLLRLALGAAVGLWLSGSLALAAEVGTIEVRDLSLRAGPGKQYRVIMHLPQGTQVRVLSHGKGWLEIEHNGRRGFIADHPRYVSVRVINEERDGARASVPKPDVQKLKNLRDKAETIDEQVRTSQTDLAVITEKEKAVINELNSADEALSRVRRQVHTAEAGLKKIDAQIDQLQKEHGEREKEIVANEAHAAQRLKALYKLSWIGRVHLLATADSFFDFIQRKSSLEKILHQDESLLEKLKRDQAAIGSVLEQLNLRKAEKRALEVSLKKQIRSLDAEQRRRNMLLSKIQGEKKLALAALVALQTAARELDSTMQKLVPEAVTVQPGAAPKTQSSFGEYKGLLSWPVRGKILSFYGPYKDKKFNVTNFQRGIDIEAERGEPIRAVADGHTIFAKWFKGFGNMMIIDHGDHYYTVYAHLEEIFKVKGDRVQGGEVIATVGDSGSLMGPALHFEVRHRGEPQDPLEWIKKG
jgi:septal ring factor EnvC (AmiA/AmiB activator)